MLLYVNTKNNVIVGSHEDHQNVDPSLYGDDIRVIPLTVPIQARPGTAPPPTTKDSLRLYVAYKSRKAQAQGVKVDAHHVSTDNLGELSHVKHALDAGHLQLTTLKTKDEKFFPVSAAYMDKIHEKVARHLHDCRKIENSLLTSIRDGEVTTYDQVDYAFSTV